ncbi:ABC transporter ATP-binding protein [Vagococcus hydrophili]|uniref:ABC transporter ATP-binding protein n=1 Tax=Vagococcus hydrophili TaxID=2714947 RepID=A0A6G8ASB4_9ENTE|nr:ABC transporter ATP-binding protein [Vagococcus hydrophili]QIL47880.1 ABC transporter ATP-binding protein [Vagococcus hydrophili]
MILNAKNVNKSYKNDLILNDLFFKIEKPKILGLVAPNGSGKTTLFNAICNLESIDSGEIYIFDELNSSSGIFNKMSYMQDSKILYTNLTGWDHLLYVAKCHKINQENTIDLISDLDMKRYVKKKVSTYSLGMKQTLLLAMSILSKPKLLLLDEPLNGLDVTKCDIFRKIILALHSTGTTVIISSHNLEEIEKLTTDILFLKSGKLISSNNQQLLLDFSKQKTEYDVILDITTSLFNVLKKAFQIEKISRYKITIRMNEYEKENFIALCKENKCTIFDIELKENMTYQLYKMLFEC